MALGAQQEPSNCAGLRRVGLCDDLADNRRTVVDLPGRGAEMGADLPPLPIKQVRLGRLERPFEATFFGSTGVDLDAVCDELEQQGRPLMGWYRHLVSTIGKSTSAGQDARRHPANHFFYIRIHCGHSAAALDSLLRRQLASSSQLSASMNSAQRR